MRRLPALKREGVRETSSMVRMTLDPERSGTPTARGEGAHASFVWSAMASGRPCPGQDAALRPSR